MAQTVLLKRSSVAGNVPGSSDLALGEIAVNTADGAVYIKKGNNDIVAVADNDILHIDTTNGRVGIGTTSPGTKLSVTGGIIRVQNGSNVTFYEEDKIHSYAASGLVIDGREGLTLETSTANTDIILSPTGNVGIGTTSPSNKLTVDGDIRIRDSIASLYLQDTDGTSQVSEIKQSAGITTISSRNNTSNGKILFTGYNGTATTEYARLDTGGTLLIGKTSADIGTIGHQFLSDAAGDYAAHTSNGNRALLLNRLNSDGEILDFRKDGSTVGSIGTTATRLYIGSGDTGIRFIGDTDEITPWNTTTNAGRSGAIDLGNTGNKFKDLHLSGTVNASLGYFSKSGGNNITINSTTANATFLKLQNSVRAYSVTTTYDGALSFYDNTGTSERARIDTSGNLLVSTTSTSPWTNSANSSSDNGIALRNDGIIAASAYKGTANSGNVAILNRTGTDGGILSFYKSGATVGSIGTASSELYIGSTTGNDAFLKFGYGAISPSTSAGANSDNYIDLGKTTSRFKDLHLSGTANVNKVVVGDGTDSGVIAPYNLYLTSGNSNVHIFNKADGSEKARIDSSGNLLVGTTNAANASAGFRAYAGGNGAFTRASTVLDLNRLSTDGTILNFQKDTASVGSIGAAAGNLYIVSNDVGLNFAGGGDGIYPATTNGGQRDAAIDLGASTHRFKDLHLSGTSKVNSITFDGNSSDPTDTAAKIYNKSGIGPTLSGYQFSVRTGGTPSESLRVDNSGNVGIGTTSPQQELTVGTLETSSIMTHGTVGIKTASDNKAINIQENSGSEGWGFGVDVSGNLNFYDSASTDPSVQFIDNGGVKFNNAYTFPTADGSANQVLQTDGSGNLTFAAVSGSSGVTVSNNANNRVLTGDGTNANAEANLTFDGSNLDLPDNIKARFGTGNDLQIYHDGSNSYVQDAGDGELRLNSDNGVRIRKHDNETLALFSVDGSASLWYNNVSKFETTSTGINVVGNILDIGGANPYIRGTHASAMRIKHTSGQTMYIRPDESGSISFFEGSTGGSIYIMTATPTVNNTTNDSTSLYFQTRSKTSGGVSQSTHARIRARTIDIANNSTELLHSGVTQHTFAENVVVSGNLTVNGTTVTNSATNTTIEDALIELGSGNTGTNSNDLGLILERGTSGNNAFIGFDESDDQVVFALTTATGSSTGNLAFSSFLPIKAAGITGTSLDINGNADISGVLTMSNTTAGSMLNMNNNSIIGVNAIQMADPGPNEGVSWSNIKIYESPDNLTTNSAGNFQVVYGSTRRFTVNNVGANVNGELLVNGANNNGGRADFAVDAGGSHSQLSLYGAQVQAGGTDMNYNAKFFHDANGGQIAVWDNNLTFTTQGSNTGSATARDIIFKPQISGTAVATERMRIKGDGSVGIGTASPTEKLHVHNGSIYVTPVTYAANQNNWGLKLGASNNAGWDHLGIKVIVDSSGSPRMALMSSGSNETISVWAGKVGIGNTAPDRKLTVSGTLGIGIDDYIVHNGDSNSFFGFNGADSWKVRTGGGDRFVIGNDNSYFNTKVGIGTTSPTTALEVIGDIKIKQGSGYSNYALIDASEAVLTLETYSNNTSTHAADILFKPAGTERMRITDDGFVGIGTASPSQVLHLKDTTPPTILFEEDSGGTQTAKISYSQAGQNTLTISTQYQSSSDSNRINFAPADNLAMTIRGGTGSKDGFVGIGTEYPEENLEIHDTTMSTISLSYEGNTGNGSSIDMNLRPSSPIAAPLTSQILFADDGAYRQNIHFKTKTSGTATSGLSTRMLIKPDGKVGIGTTNPQTTLHVEGITRITENSQTAFYGGDYVRVFGNQYYDFRNSGGSTKARINVNGNSYFNAGNVGIGTTTPTSKLHISGTSDGSGAGADAMLHVKQNGSWNGNEPWALYVEGYSYLNGFRINAADGVRALFKTTTGGTLGFATIDTAPITFTQSNSVEKMRVHSNGFVGIGNTTPKAKLSVEEYGIDTTSTSSSATTQIAIHSFAATDFRSARFTVQVTNSTDSTYHTTELLMVHDGTTANITEFGEIHTGSAVEATFDADISSGNVRLLATPASTDTMAFKVVCHSITT